MNQKYLKMIGFLLLILAVLITVYFYYEFNVKEEPPDFYFYDNELIYEDEEREIYLHGDVNHEGVISNNSRIEIRSAESLIIISGDFENGELYEGDVEYIDDEKHIVQRGYFKDGLLRWNSLEQITTEEFRLLSSGEFKEGLMTGIGTQSFFKENDIKFSYRGIFENNLPRTINK